MEVNQDNPYHDGEIDLIEILSVIQKRKYFIGWITFLSILGAAVINFYILPEIYRVSAIIDMGVINISPDGKRIPLASPNDIQGKIETGVYDARLEKVLGLPPTAKKIRYNITTTRDSNIIISLDMGKNKIDLGYRTLQGLIYELQSDYQKDIQFKLDEYNNQIVTKQIVIKSIESKKKDIDKQIAIKQNFINEERSKINLAKAQISLLDQREQSLIQEMKKTGDDSRRLIQQRELLLNKYFGNRDYHGSEDFLYATILQILQQNTFRLNELGNQLNIVKMEKEEKKASIKTLYEEINIVFLEIDRMALEKNNVLQADIDTIMIEINQIKGMLSNIKNINIVNEPWATKYPIKPRKIRNTVFFTMVGLFFGIFMAFLLEYISPRMKRCVYKE